MDRLSWSARSLIAKGFPAAKVRSACYDRNFDRNLEHASGGSYAPRVLAACCDHNFYHNFEQSHASPASAQSSRNPDVKLVGARKARRERELTKPSINLQPAICVLCPLFSYRTLQGCLRGQKRPQAAAGGRKMLQEAVGSSKKQAARGRKLQAAPTGCQRPQETLNCQEAPDFQEESTVAGPETCPAGMGPWLEPGWPAWLACGCFGPLGTTTWDLLGQRGD